MAPGPYPCGRETTRMDQATWEIADQLRVRWGEFHLDNYASVWVCASVDAYCRTHTPYIEGKGPTAEAAIRAAWAVSGAVPTP